MQETVACRHLGGGTIRRLDTTGDGLAHQFRGEDFGSKFNSRSGLVMEPLGCYGLRFWSACKAFSIARLAA